MTNPPINSGAVTSSDLTFITNEPGHALSDRFGVLPGSDTRFFDGLAGYFFLSGFHKLYPALTKTEKQRDAEAETTALELEIDELVYALYGLTEEEKAIVKGTAK